MERNTDRELEQSFGQGKKLRDIRKKSAEPTMGDILELERETLKDEPTILKEVERTSILINDKKQMLEFLRKEEEKDECEIREKTEEINRINKNLVQKELKMVELKEKIRKLKGL